MGHIHTKNKTKVDSLYWNHRLKKLSLKSTKRRLMLVDFFSQANRPVTPNEIFSFLGGKMDLTTIYRNIDHFLAKRIIKQIDFGHEDKYYELVHESEDHHHIICHTCKKVADFNGCRIDKIIKDALQQNESFVVVDAHALELFGYCRKCYNRKV